MTVDEIVQKIYEDRYQASKDLEVALYMRNNIIGEIVQRALELAIGSLAADLVDARRDRNVAREAVTVWLDASQAPSASQAPGWDTYERAEARWNAILIKLDGWIANGKEQP